MYGVKKDYTGYENDYIKVLGKVDAETKRNLDESKKHKYTYYNVLCKRCNSPFITIQSNIEKIKSCGCYIKTKWKDEAPKHIGDTYNRLTIIDVDWNRTEFERNKEPSPIVDTFYFTKCECGKVLDHSIRYNSLSTGHVKSCGCSKFNNPLKTEDLTGQKFGRLTVIGRDIERDKELVENGHSGNAHWLCRCDCGNPKLSSVVGYGLKKGTTKSCGCLASEIIAKRNKQYSTKNNIYESTEDNNPLQDENGNYRIFDENKEFSFLISKEDFDIVSKHYWRKIPETLEPNPRKRYWTTNAKIEEINSGSTSCFRLHQVIAEQKYGMYDHKKFMPDHLDRNPDNNTRENLVLKDNISNSHNRGLSRTNTSGKTGVHKNKDHTGWDAYITVNYENIYLGNFASFEEAVAARKDAELKYGFTCDDIVCDYDINYKAG